MVIVSPLRSLSKLWLHFPPLTNKTYPKQRPLLQAWSIFQPFLGGFRKPYPFGVTPPGKKKSTQPNPFRASRTVEHPTHASTRPTCGAPTKSGGKTSNFPMLKKKRPQSPCVCFLGWFFADSKTHGKSIGLMTIPTIGLMSGLHSLKLTANLHLKIGRTSQAPKRKRENSLPVPSIFQVQLFSFQGGYLKHEIPMVV